MSADGLVVLWRVFEHCNLSCVFCGYSREIVRPRVTADVARVIEFGEVLSAYSRSSGREVLISWLGGEPLLWSDLSALSERFYRLPGLRLSITTNGEPLGAPAIRASLIANYAELTLSVDGLGAAHNAYRQAPGLFERVRRNVAALRGEAEASGSSLVIKINTVLMRGNITDFEILCREVVNWGVRELTFNQLGGNDRPEFYPANRLLPEQVDRFAAELPGIRERMARLGLTIRGSGRYLQRLSSTSRDEHLGINDCQPGSSFLFIDEHGRVSPCSFTAAQYGVPLEEIASAADLERLPVIFKDRRRQRAAVCDDCHSTQAFEKFALLE